MNARSPWWLYAALVCTSGLFAYIWLILLVRDVNHIKGRSEIPSGPFIAALCAGFLAYLTILFYPRTLALTFSVPQQVLTTLLFVLALFLYLVLVATLVVVYRHTKIVLGVKFGARDVLAVIGLTVLMFVSLIMVQQNMNAAIERKAGRLPKS